MPNAEGALGEDEAEALFAPLLAYPALIVAVSGGADSSALLLLLHRWIQGRGAAPRLVVATVDHGLRPEAAQEAADVAALATRLGLPHETLLWEGEKPRSRLQEKAREARERLLVACAMRHGAGGIVLAHHADDQAETVLMRLAAGSGLTGLKGMGMVERVPGSGMVKLRPFLTVSKARLVATCQAAGLPFAEDPSNRHEAFARVRLRQSAAVLAREGLTPARLVTLSRRMRQADEALEVFVAQSLQGPLVIDWPEQGAIQIDASLLAALPQAIRLRVVMRALAARQGEGHLELSDVERLEAWLTGREQGRRTLGGVLVSCQPGLALFQRAPLRQSR